jgi:hypothetical protein
MQIYLTEGFSGESVRVTVNGSSVLELPEVRTNYSAGLAASATAEVRGRVTVTVELPGRGLRADHVTEAGEDRALLVSVGDDGVRIQETAEPVRFM